MTDLKLSIVTNKETMSSVLGIIIEKYNGLENLISGLESYEEEYIHTWLMYNCQVFVAFAENDIKAIFIFTHVGNKVYEAHWCTLDNKYKWLPFFRDVVFTEIGKYADSIIGYIKPKRRALLRLYRRYGYEPVWEKDINRWKYTIKLD